MSALRVAVTPHRFVPANLGGEMSYGRCRPGTVHVVGAGPGDPGLLTLRAAAMLTTCDLVAYDKLVSPETLALAPAQAERICVGRRTGDRPRPLTDVTSVVIEAARAGRRVVRLKGGDPFVFGRGGEEALACLDAGVPVEVVPGVSSALAGPASAWIPVTHRGVSRAFAVITLATGSLDGAPVDTTGLASFPGTLVFLMSVRSVATISTGLQVGGLPGDTPVAVIEHATTPQQRTIPTTLADLPEAAAAAGVVGPAVVVVGRTVATGEMLQAAAARGRTTLLSRAT